MRTSTEAIERLKRGPEYAPTIPEVRSLFERLLQSLEFEEVRMRKEGKELYLWDIRVREEDGGFTEYSYMRKGRYPEGEASRTAVHVTFFDADGMPTGGELIAHFEDGEWKIV